jgi:hypothetical protein
MWRFLLILVLCSSCATMKRAGQGAIAPTIGAGVGAALGGPPGAVAGAAIGGGASALLTDNEDLSNGDRITPETLATVVVALRGQVQDTKVAIIENKEVISQLEKKLGETEHSFHWVFWSLAVLAVLLVIKFWMSIKRILREHKKTKAIGDFMDSVDGPDKPPVPPAPFNG